MRAVVLHRGEDGYWVTECPSLPGCISQGKTKAEAIANIREAIQGWLETAQAHGQPVPDEDFDTQVVCVCEQAAGHLRAGTGRRFAKGRVRADRQKGSRMILFRADPPTTLTVPGHRELDRGTLRAILRQAGIGSEDLLRLL